MPSFAGTDIPPIEVILDFIPNGRHIVPIGPTWSRLRHYSRQSPSFRLHHYQSTVVTLVNILVKVFHNRDGAVDLNIDVALVPHGLVGVVWDDLTVVKDKAQTARGRGQQQKVVSHLGVQRTPRDDDVKHLVLSCFGPFLAGRLRHRHLWSGA
jgi:hypothetical protein